MSSCRPREALGLTGEDCGRRIYDYSSDRVEEESQS
ncbi:hypothetical protein FOC4_g10007951 [Fusarium odoratissimum]|uniref:Uncharacterized protein n=1 Tax=Fusarium oxysporum f. sp. cubense (strain race 4) TaxID=2502994 RepID=N1RJG1_FUSC4|nr:hypothetical protein FOC4_g10007951 [Fusarium odoratissimum]